MEPPTIVLAVSGSIAAYKAPIVARALLASGARVVPVLTRAAREFLGAQTLSGLTGEPAYGEMFDASYAGEVHVDLANRADAIVLVPATADLLARLAAGRADDLVTALVLSARCPVLAAPAMHPRMWAHAATQRNVRTLEEQLTFVGPVNGEVASGEAGVGRMADPEDIARAVLARLHPRRDLEGKRLVVTAGPTVEDLDPVRFLSNRSTGKMGFAIAERAALRGAEVTLVAGPVSLSTPRGVARIDVRSALSMQRALDDVLGPALDRADALVMTAAVGDYRPKVTATEKLKRTEESLALELVPNPDLIGTIGASRGDRARPVLVAFAVETDTDEGIAEKARAKLEKKRVDVIVANHAADAFGRDDNRVTIIDRRGQTSLGVLPKGEVADRLLDDLSPRLRAMEAP
ncbi:MAG: bifunctional phosphopantothenoylcysteine decarboxylase/phosphopantothenate--cysteine ligase CoaBC [Polyangiaceae bacterium]